MKSIFILLLSLFAEKSFGQQITLSEWNEEAKTNIRLLPKYGWVPKTAEQKSADKDFIEVLISNIPQKEKLPII